MTMNMVMIINMNIYITPENTIKLREYGMSGKSMSGLVNELLERHFGGTLAPSEVLVSNLPLKRNLSQKYAGKEKSQGLVIHDQNPVAPESASPVIKTPEDAVAAARGAQIKKVSINESKDMDFCKHGAVKGLCKKGCK